LVRKTQGSHDALDLFAASTFSGIKRHNDSVPERKIMTDHLLTLQASGMPIRPAGGSSRNSHRLSACLLRSDASTMPKMRDAFPFQTVPFHLTEEDL
jgi:hypothetical protein